jgi:sugar phosphate isomerase/epimerase
MAELALSTMWMRGRFQRPRHFFAAGVEMGFRAFELTSVAGPGFYEEIEPGEFTITSLHDPAPGDLGTGDLPKQDLVFTSLDEEKRKRAVGIAMRTVDVAARYGARAVILHIGRSEANPQWQGKLEALANAGCIASPEADAVRTRLVGERKDRYEQHLGALMRSLDGLVPYAAQRGVCLGIENRRHIHEIPNHEEVARLLAHYADPSFGYWHDVGHAETLAAVGLTPHADWLRAFGARLVGLHLHDVIGFTDHRAPGVGCVDWLGMAPLVPADGLRTAEISSEVAPADVCAGVQHLATVGWIGT